MSNRYTKHSSPFFVTFLYLIAPSPLLEGGRPEAVSKPPIRTHQALNCGRDFRSRKWYHAAICALNKIHRIFQPREISIVHIFGEF